MITYCGLEYILKERNPAPQGGKRGMQGRESLPAGGEVTRQLPPKADSILFPFD